MAHKGGNFHLKVGGAKSSSNAGDPMLGHKVGGGQNLCFSKKTFFFFFRISHRFSHFQSISSPNRQMHIISMPEMTPFNPPRFYFIKDIS